MFSAAWRLNPKTNNWPKAQEQFFLNDNQDYMMLLTHKNINVLDHMGHVVHAFVAWSKGRVPSTLADFESLDYIIMSNIKLFTAPADQSALFALYTTNTAIIVLGLLLASHWFTIDVAKWYADGNTEPYYLDRHKPKLLTMFEYEPYLQGDGTYIGTECMLTRIRNIFGKEYATIAVLRERLANGEYRAHKKAPRHPTLGSPWSNSLIKKWLRKPSAPKKHYSFTPLGSRT